MKAMNPSEMGALAAKIESAEAKLGDLEEQIEAIGMPAARELQRRVDALKIELKALKRNFSESQDGSDEERMRKVERLLRSIEHEESSVEHSAWFLSQGPSSSVVMAVEAGAKVLSAISRTVRNEVKAHPSYPSSVFVNHSHDELVDYYGLEDQEDSRKAG